jgi:deoxynucleoside triphosphate triphosphohydrolase SAMHD1
LFLNDSIICFIERNQDENLKEARTILRRLRQRDLYRFADQTIVPPELWNEVTSDKISPQEILKYCENNEKMDADDIIVQFLTLGYAMKERNPIDSVGFFTKYNDSKIVTSLDINLDFNQKRARIWIHPRTLQGGQCKNLFQTT